MLLRTELCGPKIPLIKYLICIFPDRLGYSPHGGEGWCSLRVKDNHDNFNTFVVVLANDFWIYLTFITVTVLYLSTHCYIKVQVNIRPYIFFIESTQSARY